MALRKSLILRKLRSSCLEGRTAVIVKQKGPPRGAALPLTKTGGPHGREPLPSGKDLRADGDPGHGGGRPRLVVRHRITSFQLLRRGDQSTKNAAPLQAV